MRSLLSDRQKAFDKYSPTNPSKKMPTYGLAKFRSPIKSRLSLRPITILVNQ